VNGVALIVPPGGPGYYKDFTPDAGGAIAGSIYKNSEIECNGSTGNTWYCVQVYRDGKPGPETPYSVVAATFNLNTATPTVQAPPPPPATFPYIMANPIAAQTISNFPLNFGSGSGIGANYQGALEAAGTYLRSNGSSVFAPVTAGQIATDLLTVPTLNGLVYWNGSGLSSSPTGGAGTLCATSTNGGAPAWSSCAGSTSTSWSALSAPSANLSLSMGQRTTNLSWGTGTGATPLFTFDGAAGNGTGPTVMIKGQNIATGADIFKVTDSLGNEYVRVAYGLEGVRFDQNIQTTQVVGRGDIGQPLFIRNAGGLGFGDIYIQPDAPAAVVTGGSVQITGGPGGTNMAGGFVTLTGGPGNGNGPAGGVSIGGGAGGPTGTGGAVTITGGSAGGGNNDGGKISLRGGQKAGTGIAGFVEIVDADDISKSARIRVSSLPTGTAAIAGIALTGTTSLDFDLSAAGVTCQDLTMTITGTMDGDAVSIGVPNGLASTAGITLSAWVSAANTVTVRACDVTSSNPNPAAATVRAIVWKF
jgi:hypothetical protein